jgi:hypothetical protein
MTINDLPKRLQVEGVVMNDNDDKVIVHLSEESAQFFDKSLYRIVNLPQKTKEGA